MIAAEVQSYVLSMLGYPNVSIELATEQIETAMKDALRIYNRYAPRMVWIPISVTSGVAKYEVIPPVGITITGILKCDPQRPGFQAPVDDVDVFRTPAIMNMLRNYSVADFSLLNYHQEMAINEFATDFDWEEYQDPTTKKWYVLMSPSTQITSSIIVIAAADHSIDTIPSKDQDWILKYALETSREILGEMRSKFKTIPGALGQVDMNGDDLKSDAKARKLELEAEVQARNPVSTLIMQG